jgi:hypothetical protein
MTKHEADKIAKDVLKTLGSTWTSHVWENLGWHVSWHKGAVQLYQSDRGFWAMIGEIGDADVGGHIDFHGNSDYYDDPVSAVKAACVQAQEVIEARWQPLIDSVHAILEEVS